MIKYGLLLLLLSSTLSSTAQLEQSFSKVRAGSSSHMIGSICHPYKGGYVIVCLMKVKNEPRTYALATNAKDVNGKYITGFYYKNVKYRHIEGDKSIIYRSKPTDFIHLKKGGFLICGEGYIMELDENLSQKKIYEDHRDFKYKSLSETPDGKVLVCYTKNGYAGSLIYSQDDEKISYKTSTYAPGGLEVNLVIDDKLYLEQYVYLNGSDYVYAIALKNYQQILSNPKDNNFKWQFIFEDYDDLTDLAINKNGHLVGIGERKSDEGFDYFVFDIENKKIIHKLDLTAHMDKKNLKFYKFRLQLSNSESLLVTNVGPKGVKGKYKQSYLIVLNSDSNVAKEGKLLSKEFMSLDEKSISGTDSFSYNPKTKGMCLYDDGLYNENIFITTLGW